MTKKQSETQHKLERDTHASAKVRMLLLILAPCTPRASPGLLTAVDDPATPSNSLAFSASSLFEKNYQSNSITHRYSRWGKKGVVQERGRNEEE